MTNYKKIYSCIGRSKCDQDYTLDEMIKEDESWSDGLGDIRYIPKDANDK